MRLFRRQRQGTSVFPIQSDGAFGRVENKHHTEIFEDAIGERSRHDPVSRNYLGLTIPGRRFRLGGILFLCAMFLLVGRAAHLQIIQGNHFAELAEGNRFRTHTLVPPRGIVYDRDGDILIENVPSFVLTMTIADLPDEETERNEVLTRVADLSGANRTDLDLLITEHATNPLEPVPVKKGLSYEAAMRLAIATSALPGFHLETSSTRSYKNSALSLSHVLGYMGKLNEQEVEVWREKGYRRVDEIGKAGIERSAETILRGVSGKFVVEVDAQGDEISMISKEDPIAGSNISLGIDADLQQFIEGRLRAVEEKIGTRKMSVVAMDPQTGSIRALVSLPSYDSNAFARGIDANLYKQLIEDPDQPLFPRATSGEYPSGSTFKPFVAYAALAEGIVTPSTSFVSVGGLRIGVWFFPDWRGGGHGVTDVRKAIADSVNTYFYIVGGGYDNITGLGVDRITSYAREFGFGSQTGIDLPNEADGFLPSKEWKEEVKGERWYVGDTYHLAIGQGDMLATPLQIAVGTSIIANGGTRVIPHVIEKIDGVTLETPIAEGEPLNTDALQVVQEGMRQTVTQGSGRFLSSLPQAVAGKTGTAQASGDNPTHAWFTGYGPYENPSLAVTVLVEYGGEGSSVAVPIARDIFEWWFANEPTP